MRTVRCAAIALLVMLWPLLVGPAGARASSGGAYRLVRGASIPAAAQELARRLGLHGRPFIGDQTGGAGRPWAVWFPDASSRSRCGFYTARGVLFSGPLGARGVFHFYDSSPLSPCGADSYHGRPLTRAHAVKIALQWLRHAGVPIPPGPMHVLVRPGTTNIDGTGLCCFKYLAPVWWGRKFPVESFLQPAKYEVYVADAGTVVQVDMGEPAAHNAERLAYPCAGDRRDRNGIALGPWCFSYADAVDTMAFTQIGGHDGLATDPASDAQRALVPIQARTGPLRQVARSSTRAAYRVTAKGVTYEVSLVPAFPGLTGTPWEITSVRALGRTPRGAGRRRAADSRSSRTQESRSAGGRIERLGRHRRSRATRCARGMVHVV